MSKGDIHTVKHGDGWANRAKATSGSLNTASIKAEAQAEGRDMAIERGVEQVVQYDGAPTATNPALPHPRPTHRILPATRLLTKLTVPPPLVGCTCWRTTCMAPALAFNRSGKHEVASFFAAQLPRDAAVRVGH